MFAIDQKVGSHPVGHREVGNGIFTEPVQQFLLLFVVMPVAHQFPHDEFRVFEKRLDDPFDLSCLWKF